MKQKLLSILALLLMAATGAWADESSESFTTTSGAASYTGEHFNISVDDVGDSDGFFLEEITYARIEALNGEIITKVEFTAGYYDITRLRSGVGTTTYEGEVATVSGVNATSLTVNADIGLQIKAVKVYYSTPTTESFTTNSGASSYTGTNVQINVDDEGDGDGFYLDEGTYARIEVSNSYIITKVEFTQGYGSITDLRSAVGTTTYEGEVATVSGVNATSLTVNAANSLQIKAVKVYYTTAPTVPVTANEGATGEYWATYYNATQGFTADANTTVFKAALAGSQLTMTEVANREIPAGKAVILKSTSSTITLTPATTTETLEGNALQGTATAITNPGNAYVLNKGAKGVGFYKLRSTGTIGANKAYLTYSGAGAREFFLFDETTGIEMPTAEVIEAEAVVNDLQGRRVQNPVKGLYIVNGKKVVIK